MQGSGCHYSQSMVYQTPKYDNAIPKRRRKKRKRKHA